MYIRDQPISLSDTESRADLKSGQIFVVAVLWAWQSWWIMVERHAFLQYRIVDPCHGYENALPADLT